MASAFIRPVHSSIRTIHVHVHVYGYIGSGDEASTRLLAISMLKSGLEHVVGWLPLRFGFGSRR